MKNSILSPCRRVCNLHEDGTHCMTCKRTIEEITNWTQMTDEERLRIMREVRLRNYAKSDQTQ